MRIRSARALGVTVAAGIALTLVACSPGGDAEPETTFDPEADVTITVGGKPLADQAASLEQFERLVADFQELHPNITVVGEETRYDPQTFNSLLAGGQLPTTMTIPFTDIQGLIARGQAADVTEFVEADDEISALNEQLFDVVTADDRQYGFVHQAYTMGLSYDRAVYEAAGLDPDDPPTSWEEVLENAIAISENTDATGFIFPTTGNYGGWMLTTMAYTNGSLAQEADGDEVTVTVLNDGFRESLEWLHELRWEHDAAGANFLYADGDLKNAMAGGQIGQSIGGPAYFDLVVRRGMPAENVGIAPIPQSDDSLGALGGGAVTWFNPEATAEEIYAALQFRKFHYLSRYTDEEQAVSWAEAQDADSLPIGVPEYPLVSQESYDDYLGWIGSYINVDRDAYTAYLDSVYTTPVVLEPAVRAQELYAALDPVVQAVLTREDADIDELLQQVETQIQSLVDQG
jgi:multiple sugar transport system substrate-binding protein